MMDKVNRSTVKDSQVGKAADLPRTVGIRCDSQPVRGEPKSAAALNENR